MCTVDGDGVRGREPVHASPFFAAWLNRIVAAQELTVEAALNGDRELVHAAMLLDPHAGVLGLATIEQMTDELLTATSRWLPQFRARPPTQESLIAARSRICECDSARL
jgi:alpha-galactosidase